MFYFNGPASKKETWAELFGYQLKTVQWVEKPTDHKRNRWEGGSRKRDDQKKDKNSKQKKVKRKEKKANSCVTLKLKFSMKSLRKITKDKKCIM